MSNDEKVIKFQATVQKAQTLADGGLRLTLDLPESAIKEMADLMRVKQVGAALEVVAVPVFNYPGSNLVRQTGQVGH